MTEWLFNAPLWLPVSVAGVGLALLYFGNLRQEKPIMRLGMGLLAVAGLVAFFGWLVTTDREDVEQQTRRLVQSVRDRDFAAFSSIMDESVQMKAVVTIYRGRNDFTSGARATLDRIGLRSVKVLGMELQPAEGGRFEVFVNALSEQDIAPYPTTTSWRLDFEKRGEGWKIVAVEALIGRDGMVTPERVRERMVKP
jgi:hypothetical protein